MSACGHKRSLKGVSWILSSSWIAVTVASGRRCCSSALAQIKNPSVVFARQANIAHGPQQVNNAMMPAGEPRAGGKNENTPNELFWKRNRMNGWIPERRARQAALIRNWRPREAATGLRTADGKARSARNALRHGGRTASALAELAEIRRMVREMEAEEREIRQRVCE